MRTTGAVFLALAMASASPARGGEWQFRTLAGNPYGGGYADGPGATARFSNPSAVAVCTEAIFVADSGNHAIRRISRGGDVTTWAGSLTQPGSADGPRTTARFNRPSGIAADADCNLYVGDRDNHTIRRITREGEVSTFAGTAGQAGISDGSGGAARFFRPQHLAVDSDGSIWVADEGNRRIRRIDPAGEVKTIATLPAPPSVSSGKPLGIAVDAGAVYVADYPGERVYRMSKQGGLGVLATKVYPSAIAVDADGSLLVANYVENVLQRVTSDGTVSLVAGRSGEEGTVDGAGTAARLNHPRGIVRDLDGSFIIADDLGCTIRRTTSSGEVTTVAGARVPPREHLDGIGTAARFELPGDVDVDVQGVAYVGDRSTIRRIAPDGTTTTIAGTAGELLHRDGNRAEARFNGASGIAVEPGGSLVVVDANAVVRRVLLDGTVTTIAGAPGTTGDREGVGDQARFNYITAIAVAPDGTIYVTDALNKAVRRIVGNVVTTLVRSPTFQVPMGLDVDGEGNVYMWDENVPSIFRITPAGQMTIVASDPAMNTLFGGIAVAANGEIFIGGYTYHAIRRLRPGSTTIEPFAGADLSIGNQNGAPEATRFRSPNRLEVAPDGRLFVCDLGNLDIRVATSTTTPPPPRRRAVTH